MGLGAPGADEHPVTRSNSFNQSRCDDRHETIDKRQDVADTKIDKLVEVQIGQSKLLEFHEKQLDRGTDMFDKIEKGIGEIKTKVAVLDHVKLDKDS